MGFAQCELMVILMDVLLFLVNVEILGIFKSPYHYKKNSCLMLGCAHMI
jgi:hypothetical protein